MLVEEHEYIVNKTIDVLDKAVQPNGTQIVTGNDTFTNFTTKEVLTEEMITKEVVFENSTLTVEDLTIDVQELAKNISKLYDELNDLLKKLEGKICGLRVLLSI